MQPSETFIPRDLAIQFGSETVHIIESGEYRAPSGGMVNIADLLEFGRSLFACDLDS
jgi:hypothetical protein